MPPFVILLSFLPPLFAVDATKFEVGDEIANAPAEASLAYLYGRRELSRPVKPTECRDADAE